jgi:hypothetical protein
MGKRKGEEPHRVACFVAPRKAAPELRWRFRLHGPSYRRAPFGGLEVLCWCWCWCEAVRAQYVGLPAVWRLSGSAFVRVQRVESAAG